MAGHPPRKKANNDARQQLCLQHFATSSFPSDVSDVPPNSFSLYFR